MAAIKVSDIPGTQYFSTIRLVPEWSRLPWTSIEEAVLPPEIAVAHVASVRDFPHVMGYAADGETLLGYWPMRRRVRAMPNPKAKWLASRTGYTPYGESSYDIYKVGDDEVEVYGIPAGIYFEEELPEEEHNKLMVEVIWDGAVDFSGEIEDAIARYPELAAAGAFG